MMPNTHVMLDTSVPVMSTMPPATISMTANGVVSVGSFFHTFITTHPPIRSRSTCVWDRATLVETLDEARESGSSLSAGHARSRAGGDVTPQLHHQRFRVGGERWIVRGGHGLHRRRRHIFVAKLAVDERGDAHVRSSRIASIAA